MHSQAAMWLPLGSYLLNEDAFLHTQRMPYKPLENLSKSPVTDEELGSPNVIFARGYGDILHFVLDALESTRLLRLKSAEFSTMRKRPAGK
jgi:hypothetical protein